MAGHNAKTQGAETQAQTDRRQNTPQTTERRADTAWLFDGTPSKQKVSRTSGHNQKISQAPSFSKRMALSPFQRRRARRVEQGTENTAPTFTDKRITHMTCKYCKQPYQAYIYQDRSRAKFVQCAYCQAYYRLKEQHVSVKHIPLTQPRDDRYPFNKKSQQTATQQTLPYI